MYENVRYYIKRVVESGPSGVSMEVQDVLENLDVGSDALEFWRLMVEATPVLFYLNQLERVCNQSQSSSYSDIRMWKSLVLWDLSDYGLSLELLSPFQKERKRDPQKIVEQIEFRKRCIRQKPSQSHYLCRRLADAYKWKREHNSLDISTAFDDEISMWRTLLLKEVPKYAVEWGDYGIPDHLQKAIRAQADAIRDNLQSVWKYGRVLESSGN
jgi:hypothetical protein